MSQKTGKIAKNTGVRFAISFALILGLFYLIYTPLSQSAGYGSYLGFLAEASNLGVNLVGQEARVQGRAVMGPANCIFIVPGCDGMEALALFAAAVLASPVPWKQRLVFFGIGTAALFVINIVRLVSIFLVGIRYPDLAETLHWDIWPGILIVAILGCWLLWARWIVRRLQKTGAIESPKASAETD